MLKTIVTTVFVLFCSAHLFAKAANLRRTDFEDDGVVELIMKSYADELLDEIQRDYDAGLTDETASLLKGRIVDLYNHIKQHPALRQRHLWVGRGAPPPARRHTAVSTTAESLSEQADEPQGEEDAEGEGGDNKRMLPKREGMSLPPSEEICQTTTQWEQINKTQDYDGNEVEIVQDEIQQYVFSYRCVTPKKPCTGISVAYHSECAERKGWIYLYHRPLEGTDKTAKWGYVSVHHHCVCKVTPKPPEELLPAT